MARDQSRPVTDDDLESARESIREQREDIREYLDGEGVDTSDWDEKSHEGVPGANREPADSD